jgi:hypothetical protein
LVVCLLFGSSLSPLWERGERKGIVMSGTGLEVFLFSWDGKKVRGFSPFFFFFFLLIVSLYLLSWGSLEVLFFSFSSRGIKRFSLILGCPFGGRTAMAFFGLSCFLL